MRELQPLRLPQIVEARKLQEACAGCPFPTSSSTTGLAQSPQSPAQPEWPSPSIPNASLRGHSAIPNCALPTTRDSLEGIMPIKRPLTEVKEELDPDDESDAVEGKVSGIDQNRKYQLAFFIRSVRLLTTDSSQRFPSTQRQKHCSRTFQHHSPVHV